MARFNSILLLFVFLTSFTIAAFPNAGDFFEQMFHQQQQQKPPENAPSNTDHYQREFASVHCDKYLCAGTLACVHFPHHCPCAFPTVEEKVELGEGISVCASKGGFNPGEMERKVELARKAML